MMTTTNEIWLLVLLGGLVPLFSSVRIADASEAAAVSVGVDEGDDDGGGGGVDEPSGGEDDADKGGVDGGSAGVCEEGKVCCNVYDDWPEKGKKICMAKDECVGIGKDVVPELDCK